MTIIKCGGIEVDTEKLTVDDMPTEVFREIFVLCGVNVAMELLLNMPGNIIQVPARGLANIEKRLILQAFEKFPPTTALIRRLCRDFKTSEWYIRDLLVQNKKQVPCDGQGHLDFINSEGEVQ